MKIKAKLNLGIGLLFTLIILLAILSVNQINSLATASKNIIKDNKETIDYTRKMLEILAESSNNINALEAFEENLLKQKSNITEKGEQELTENLSMNFYLLKQNPLDTAAFNKVQSNLFEIMKINLAAIEYKNSVAANTAHKSILLISLLSIFCFLIALILFVKLPGNISNPIKELTNSINKIAANDYSLRLNFESHNEFGELAKSFNLMASKLDEYNRSNISKLLAEKKITETLINKIHFPIIGFDKNLAITFANEEFSKISGLNSANLIGKHALELATDNEIIRQVLIIDSSSNKKLTDEQTGSKIHIEQQGKDLYFEKEIQKISYTPEKEKDERLLGYVIILRNVTKFMELDLAKTNFIATVSHELKTPISAIKLSVQLLENEKTGILNSEQRDLIKGCEDDTNQLLKIISELLNLTQVETGNIQLKIMPVNLIDILQYAINRNKPLAEQKKITFDMDLPNDLPEILADKEKTAWVFTNLISNAIHYSHENSKIFLLISRISNQIKISIKDTGQGIEPQYKDKIFDRYFRVPGTEKEGTGLGLAISKEFIEAQGGKIFVDSELGTGSTFTITLNCKT